MPLHTTTEIDVELEAELLASGTPDTGPCAPGDELAGKYTIEALVGMGGMGYVYSARALRSREKVAIKFLHPRLLPDVDKTERFLREARATASLTSEHIVRVLDVGKRPSDGLPYLVMEFLEGEDLGEWLTHLGPFPTELAVHFVIQACRALSVAHAAGIVHRDIKPANLILVRRPGDDAFLKVLDFGISKEAVENDHHAITHTSAVFGSPTYMSPEQVRSAKSVDARTDVWALGVVLFELLAGEPPFEGESPGAIFAAIVADLPRNLGQLRPDIPRKLVKLVERCLVKQRDERMPSVDELAARLEPFLAEASSSQSSGALTADHPQRRTVRLDGGSITESHAVLVGERTMRLPQGLGESPALHLGGRTERFLSLATPSPERMDDELPPTGRPSLPERAPPGERPRPPVVDHRSEPTAVGVYRPLSRAAPPLERMPRWVWFALAALGWGLVVSIGLGMRARSEAAALRLQLQAPAATVPCGH